MFGHYACISVDIDLSKKVFDEILVEREGFAFKVEVQYEQRPFFFVTIAMLLGTM